MSAAGEHDVRVIRYLDLWGGLLRQEPTSFKRLHAVGETLVLDRRIYAVIRVALQDDVEHANLEPVGECAFGELLRKGAAG